MKQLLLFILMITALSSPAQNKYRFSVGGGFHSMMFWGLRDFEDVVCPNGSDFFKIYQNETYKLNYKNFQFSNQYVINFGVNWVTRSALEIHHSFSFYRGNFSDQIRLTLTEANGLAEYFYPDTNYNPTNVTAGIQGTTQSEQKFAGVSSKLVLNRLIGKNIWVGGGLGISYFGAMDDLWRKTDGYGAIVGLGRGRWSSTTVQAVLTASVSYRIKFIDVYFRLSQNVATLKKDENKGHEFWPVGYSILPVSHNFDYRFPLTFETGIALSFDRIRK
jgi:hypothetical protein